ncbi:hypothetical protein OTU49_013086 [Cherax quadricarinatus]|uniref:Secreted protein n=1 Tax=Cherax quadricarinatus TaxID=27406 RepID=A0AAW0VVA3_CHEQU
MKKCLGVLYVHKQYNTLCTLCSVILCTLRSTVCVLQVLLEEFTSLKITLRTVSSNTKENSSDVYMDVHRLKLLASFFSRHLCYPPMSNCPCPGLLVIRI